ncbi:MAG: hypothetical protein ACREOI_00185 [bacterium]
MKKNSKETGPFLKVSELFPDVEYSFKAFKELLSGLSRTDVILWCSRLNLIISSSSDIDKIIREKLSLPKTLPLETVDDIADLPHIFKQFFYLSQALTETEKEKVINYSIKKSGNITILFRAQLLEVLRWSLLLCQDLPNDGNTFEDLEVRRKFLKTLLLASEVWAQRVFKNFPVNEDDLEDKRKDSLGIIYKSVEATSSAPDFARTFGRGSSIIKDCLPKHYSSFDEEFKKVTHISIDEYYICLAAFAANFIDPARGTGIFNYQEVINSPRFGNTIKQFLDIESQSLDGPDGLKQQLWGPLNETISDIDEAPVYRYRPLRNRPILRTNDQRAIILDPIFFCEKSYLGPLFHLLGKDNSTNRGKELISYFGKAFEDYACAILKRMFPDTSSILAKRLSCDIDVPYSAKGKLQIDACLNDGNEIVVFEMKGGLLSEEKMLFDNPELTIQHIRKKYSAMKGINDEAETIGIGQLVRIIELLVSKKWLGPQNEFKDVNKIFPVLLVYDSNLAAPVFGNFFVSEFEDFFKDYAKTPDNNYYLKNELQVTPPIVMTIDDLENLEESISQFGFREMLSDYSKKHADRLTSLYNFLALSNYKKMMSPNKNLAEKGMRIMQQSKQALFGADL